MCKAITEHLGAESVYGCQRIGGVWRLYLNSIEARTTLINEQLLIDSERYHVYNDNPFRAGINYPDQEVVKITIKDWALSKDAAPLSRYLESQGVHPTTDFQQGKIRDPTSHKLSEWFNGDVIIYSRPLRTPLPRYAYVADKTIRIFHNGQAAPEKLCTRCFSKQHTRGQCRNSAVCVRCRNPDKAPGHDDCVAMLQQPSDGVHAVYGADDPLSAFYNCDLKVFGRNFTSAEHAYQYTKAIRTGHPQTAERILNTRQAIAAKQINRTQLGNNRREPSWNRFFF